MEPPALPRTAQDLVEWSVYADHLMTIGDPLGERIATELALSRDDQLGALATFHERVKRFCPIGGRAMFTSWCLGFARAIELRPKADPLSRLQHVEDGALARARDFLRSRAGARVEELQLPAPHVDDRPYRRLFAALPPSCRRVTLTHEPPAEAGVDMLLACLPPTVREVRLATQRWSGIAPRFVTDRFATIEVHYSTLPELDDLRPALDASSSVRVRIDRIHGPFDSRLELGGPADVAVVALDPRPGRYVLGRPPKLVPMEARFAWVLPRDRSDSPRAGVIWVRHLFARNTEIKAVCLDPDPTVEYPRVTLMQRDGEWTAKCWEPMTLDGHVIQPQTVVPIRNNARFTIAGRSGLFLSSEIDVQARAALA